MNEDRLKGKANDVAGRVKRQVGEWTGDTESEVEGAAQQIKGKAENAWGKLKDATRDATEPEREDSEKPPRKRDVA